MYEITLTSVNSDTNENLTINLNNIAIKRINKIFEVEIFNPDKTQEHSYNLGYCISYPNERFNFLDISLIFLPRQGIFYSGPPNRFPGLYCYLQCNNFTKNKFTDSSYHVISIFKSKTFIYPELIPNEKEI